MRGIVVGLGALGLCWGMAGCAPLTPLSQLVAVEMAVHAAEQAGAAGVTEAAPYMAAARSRLERALYLANRGGYEQALAVGVQARLDAELATALVERARAEARAAKARASLEEGEGGDAGAGR